MEQRFFLLENTSRGRNASTGLTFHNLFCMSFSMERPFRFLGRISKDFHPLKRYFIKNRWSLALGFMCLLLVDFLQLLIPQVIRRAVDLLTVRAGTQELLLKHGLAILAIASLIALFRYVWRHLILGHARVVEKGLRRDLYEHLQKLSFSFYQRTKSGDIMAMAVNDLNAIRMAAGMGIVALTDGIVLGTAAIGFMMSISTRLTLISLIPAPVIILFSWTLTRRMSSGFERVQDTFSHLTEQVREAFAGIRVIKTYGREEWEKDRVEKEGRKYIRENMDLARTLALFFPMMAIFTNLGIAVVIWLGGRLTILGDISTGDFVAFISYLNLLTWPMMAMGWVTNLIQRGSASMRRINRILDETPEIQDPAQPIEDGEIKGEIRVRGLDFTYPGHEHNTLKDISLRIAPGETVALIGRVGAGKTTLLHLIPRLIDPPEQTLFVDGMDIRRIPLKRLRENIGFVSQEIIIFSDTVRNNVLFGREDVSDDTLERALVTAGIQDDIEALEQGLDTRLGERGVTLSGGQRQRLTIARALIQDPPILILDDALSMVDTLTEERILNNIYELRRNRTTLIVSHRTSTISMADRIIVMDGGRIAEQGTHGDLIKREGMYARIYQRHFIERELEKEFT